MPPEVTGPAGSQEHVLGILLSEAFSKYLGIQNGFNYLA